MDIFLLMGQSNMAGRGLLEDVEPIRDERIRAFQDDRWTMAEEPLHHDRPTAGIGLAMSFAQSVLAAGPDREIGLVPRAVGSTPLERWMPGADLYEGAMVAAREATHEGTVKAVLWHQGEHDSKSEADASSYVQRFQRHGGDIEGATQRPFPAGDRGRAWKLPFGTPRFSPLPHRKRGVAQDPGCRPPQRLHQRGRPHRQGRQLALRRRVVADFR